MGAVRPIFYARKEGSPMGQRSKNTVRAAIIAALYVVLTHMQNLLLPGSASWAIQFRISEALCVLAMFTPAAISGLSIGCFLFNLTFAAALPLDMVVGTLATFLAAIAMWKLRRIPVVPLLMPALFNALLVGWELSVYIGGGFVFNAITVAIGEAAVLLTLGALLNITLKKHRIFSKNTP
jgi:uncharacterized membrane protein